MECKERKSEESKQRWTTGSHSRRKSLASLTGKEVALRPKLGSK
jgi:hypothetical protein